MTREERLARTFVELADTLVDDFDVIDLMVLLTERCVELLDASAAGLLLTDQRGVLTVVAATSEAVETVELFQVQADEGPCRDCVRSAAPITVADLADEADRWPRFAPVATRAGFRSADAVPLRLRETVLGALNLFRAEPGPLARSEIATAQAMADVATISLLQGRALHDAQVVAEQLEDALHSRIAIEQAKGIVAEWLGMSTDEAFAHLRRFGRSRQMRLTDVAVGVIVGRVGPADLPTAAGR